MKKFLLLFLFLANFNLYAQNKSENPKVSVIIPAYNVEKYIEQCLESVLNQTYKNLEVIIIDDCSTDNTYKILKEYARNDNRIRLYRQNKNGGASRARNTGMKYTTGDYLYFIDSDDWIDLNYISEMVKAAKKSDADIIINKNISLYANNKNYGDEWGFGKKINTGFNRINGKNLYSIQPFIWYNLYKFSYINKVKPFFPNDLLHEDLYFIVMLLVNTDDIFVINASKYNYRIRENSLTGSRRQNETKFDVLTISKMLHEYLKNNNLLDKGKIDLNLIKLALKLHVEPERFYNKTRELFLEIENDVKNNIEIYEKDELKFFNDVIKHDSYDSYSKYLKKCNILLKIKLFLILLIIITVVLMVSFIFLKCLYLFALDIIKYIKNKR